jgi:hypothetical protein
MSGLTTEFFERGAILQSSNLIPHPDRWSAPPVEWIGSRRISESVIAITTQGRRLDVRPDPSSAEKVMFSMMRSPIAMGSSEFSNPGTHISSSSRAGSCEVEFHNESLTVTYLIADRLGIDGGR